MNDEGEFEGAEWIDGEPDSEALAAAPGSVVSDTLAKALLTARDKLLDRSLRNKLISTPVTSSRARQVRVFDELSDQTFAILHTGKAMTFTPASAGSESSDDDDQGTWVPPETIDEGSGPAARHTDTKLQTKMTPEGLQKRLLSLFYEGQTLEEEQGVNVLFLALGFLEWREAKQSEIARFAPLVLIPVELHRDGAKDRFKLTIRDEDLIANVSLQAWLKEQFGVVLPDIPEVDDWKPSEYFDAARQSIGDRTGWGVRSDEILLGFFSFSKFLLWRDLDPANWPNPAALMDSELLKTILLRDHRDEPLIDVPLVGPEERIDEVFRPAELVHVTDADSSQAIAIQEALSGKNLVIQGPPGTGKSQTITNIIAGAVHAGKRVLFIAEKMAALEVVHDRLVACKLGPICLELHSRKSSKTQVLDQIKQGRNAASPPSWPSSVFNNLEETQKDLRAHADRLHDKSDGLSAFDLHGKISLLKARATPAPNFTVGGASGWSTEQVGAAARRASQLGERLADAGPPCSHPWRGIGIGVPDMLEQERLVPLIQKLAESSDKLTISVERANEVLSQTTADRLDALAIWVAALRHVGTRPEGADDLLADGRLSKRTPGIRQLAMHGRSLADLKIQVAEAFRSEAWSDDWTVVRKAIASHGPSLFRMIFPNYRLAVAELRGVWAGELPRSPQVRLTRLDELIEAQRLTAELKRAGEELSPLLGYHWQGEQTDWLKLEAVAAWIDRAAQLSNGFELQRPEALIDPARAISIADELESEVQAALKALADVASAVGLDPNLAFDERTQGSLSAGDVHDIASRWQENSSRIVQWPPIRDDLDWLRSINCEEFAEQIFTGAVTATQVEPILMLAVYEAMWTKLRAAHPGIDTAQGDQLTRVVERFCKADKDRIRVAADEVARAHIDGHPTGSAGAVGVLIQETKKSRNLKPVRKLMVEAGEAIQRFKPVFMMSPLSVAQYLKPGLIDFDLLVIDEASQIRPEDALGAIARCRQLVVVGDDRQLPPTNFFNRMINDEAPDEDDDEETGHGKVRRAAVKDIESILNLCSQFPPRMLRWHYRSEHPSLIATSNRNFYEGKLMLPPSVIARANDGKTGLMFHKVDEGHYERGRTARNEFEAEEVAQAVLRHARECPELSLGIGTFSVAQRDCVRDRLDDLARKHPELDAFLKATPDRAAVFVKNLENIQGDERDVVFISVGYGRDANGKLTQNFGPVGRDGGERRLNVLITRARKRCEVFSSLVAEDIRFDGLGKPGVRALKEFLKLAKDGYSALSEDTGRTFDSDFEEAVAYAIRELGYDCRPQVGMAGFFIDLAVLDPKDSDRYLLGIECDGAAYHSSQYARDRDRLRQAILEKRGWKIHRIWSTDWFYRREREIEKLKASIQAAIEGRELSEEATAYDPLAGDADLNGGVNEGPGDGFYEPESDAPSELDRGARRLRPYELATFSVSSTAVKPQDLSDGQLAYWVTKIVEIEQPIHSEEVGRRLAMCCGWQRAGRIIQEAALRGLLAGKRKGDLIRQDEFWFLDDGQDVLARDRSALESAEPVRRAELISGVEFAAAAIHALHENLALSRDELVIETARLLGFARVGKDIAAAIGTVIDEDLTDDIEHDHLGRIRLKSTD